MPSTTTTSVTIGTILDLLGPIAPPTPSSKDQPAFDALLKPPSPRDRRPQCLDEADASSPAPSSPPESAGDSLAEETQPQDGFDNHAPQAAESSELPNDDSTTDQDQPSAPAAETLVQGAVAGLAAIAPLATALNSAVDASGNDEPTETTLAEVAPTGRKQQRGRAGQREARMPPITTPEEPLPINPASHDASGAKTDTPQQVDAAIQQEAAPSPADVAVETSADQAATTDSLVADPLVATNQLDLPASNDARDANTPASDQQNERSPAIDATTTTLGAGGQSAQTDRSASDAARTAPAAAPPVTLPAAGNSTQNGAASTPASTNISAAESLRSRIPADVLTQPGRGPHRPSGVQIDSARLLTRVARAFTAAQERDGEIRLRLSPPELGALRLEIRVQDGALVARLQTETEAARAAILDNLPALRDRLTEQGVRIERFDVDLMQRQPGGMPDQTGGRQQDTPDPSLRSVPRLQPISVAQSGASSSPSTVITAAAGGLNVIV